MGNDVEQSAVAVLGNPAQYRKEGWLLVSKSPLILPNMLLQASGAFAGIIGGHLFSLQCGRLAVDGPMAYGQNSRRARCPRMNLTSNTGS
jgi:hypothetical protein